MYTLHHDDIGGAVVPVHLWHLEQRRVLEVAPQLIGISGFADEVELVMQIVVELADDLERAQAPRVGRHPREQPAEGAQQ